MEQATANNSKQQIGRACNLCRLSHTACERFAPPPHTKHQRSNMAATTHKTYDHTVLLCTISGCRSFSST
jgi:predicted transcriptional regulator